MGVLVGITICIIVAILLTHFTCDYEVKKQSEVLSRVEMRYFDSDELVKQQAELAAENAVVEEEAQRKGIIESIQ